MHDAIDGPRASATKVRCLQETAIKSILLQRGSHRYYILESDSDGAKNDCTDHVSARRSGFPST